VNLLQNYHLGVEERSLTQAIVPDFGVLVVIQAGVVDLVKLLMPYLPPLKKPR